MTVFYVTDSERGGQSEARNGSGECGVGRQVTAAGACGDLICGND